MLTMKRKITKILFGRSYSLSVCSVYWRRVRTPEKYLIRHCFERIRNCTALKTVLACMCLSHPWKTYLFMPVFVFAFSAILLPIFSSHYFWNQCLIGCTTSLNFLYRDSSQAGHHMTPKLSSSFKEFRLAWNVVVRRWKLKYAVLIMGIPIFFFHFSIHNPQCFPGKCIIWLKCKRRHTMFTVISNIKLVFSTWETLKY